MSNERLSGSERWRRIEILGKTFVFFFLVLLGGEVRG